MWDWSEGDREYWKEPGIEIEVKFELGVVGFRVP
jgi:hypothetical protein